MKRLLTPRKGIRKQLIFLYRKIRNPGRWRDENVRRVVVVGPENLEGWRR
jgi:hypothetical protein